MKTLTQQFIKTILIVCFSMINLSAGVLGTPADIVTLGTATKSWLDSRGDNNDNIHKMFYHVDKKLSTYVELRLTDANKIKICNTLNKSSLQFLNGLKINNYDFREDFYSEAKKQNTENPSLSIEHYLFSDLKSYSSSWFYDQFQNLLLGKITNADIKKLEFHNVDITKYELSNLFSLDNSYYAGNKTVKNQMHAILINSAINLSGFRLLEKHCNIKKKELVFLDNNYYQADKWHEKIYINKTIKTIGNSSLNMAKLASDAYLSYDAFKNKYKNETNKIGTAEFNNVIFFVIEENDKIYITFRGTSSKENTKTDLNIRHVKFLNIPNSEVHSGFYNIAVHAKEILNDLIKKDKSIIISGHSLGGGVGLLLGGIIYQENENKNISIYSFGAPPVGNQLFVNSIQQLKHTRYTHQKDIIPKINKDFGDKIKNITSEFTKTNEINLTRLPMSLITKFMTSKVGEIPYDFVHHSEEIQLLNTPIISNTLNEKINFAKKLVLFDDAHSILTYIDGIEKESY